MVSVLNNCAEGTSAAAAVLLRQRGPGIPGTPGAARAVGFQPDAALVQVRVARAVR